ncbi:25-hydroxycholesterol 7-alpha-hydroxylase [Zalerion maritima]|uniref:25-hydroxycholesterol 7-alpha-hydroxylase n=1 Tax=Zalerion maritima TaxID=339359 RepID=A0AAD5RTM0_9PEZI|nr:25-hydroxycholesterol 7-alpha-hydroxylase [Zalerion maritima]
MEPPSKVPTPALCAAAVLVVAAVAYLWLPSTNSVLALPGAIPCVSNTWLYTTDMESFLLRASVCSPSEYPTGEWLTVRVMEVLRKDMAEAAIVSLAGPRILELNPDLLEILWEFDEIAASLVWGLPRWLSRKAWNRRDRFGAVQVAITGLFACALVPFPQCSPMTIWCVMEVAKDPALFRAVRDEVMTAYVTDPATSKCALDLQAVLSLPVLQSIYTESLRLRLSINITREVMEPMTVDDHKLEKGSLLQAPSEMAHYGEAVWDAEGHPASEFWAESHITYFEMTDEAGNL